MEEQQKEVKKITFGFVFGWALGILAAITGIVWLFLQPLIGFLYLLVAVVLLPPTNDFIAKKLKFSLSGGLRFIIVAILLVIITVIPTTLTTKITPKEEASTSTTEATWQEVKSWQGTGIKKTEPFLITGDRWRIEWAIKDTTGFGASMLQIFVYKPGGELPLELLANAMGTASDTSYVYKKGEFYLDINSANGNWEIIVEELK